MTGRCRAAVGAALRRLEATGIIRIIRRLKRVLVTRVSPITGLQERVTITCQDSNLYAFNRPDGLVMGMDAFIEAYAPPSPRRVNDTRRLMHRLDQAEYAVRPETISLLNLMRGKD
jgi:hypothetical protein